MMIVILFYESYYSQRVIDSLNIFIAIWAFLFGNQLSQSFLVITILLKLCLVVLQALNSFFHQVKGMGTGISIIDSTKLVVCHNLRIKRRVYLKVGKSCKK